jgi:hypothetical protein
MLFGANSIRVGGQLLGDRAHRRDRCTWQLLVEQRRAGTFDPRHPAPYCSASRSSTSPGLQQIVTPIGSGGILVFAEGRFDAAKVVDLIDTEAINVWWCVPTMVSRVMDNLEDSSRLALKDGPHRQRQGPQTSVAPWVE